MNLVMKLWMFTIKDKLFECLIFLEELNVVGDGSVTRRRLPSVEDICMKDSKILNTNVLAVLDEVEVVATDSAKFHKPDNTQRSTAQTSSSNSMSGGGGVSGVMDGMMMTTEEMNNLEHFQVALSSS